VDVVAFKQHADVIAGRMWACRRQACESASRCRSTLNNELIFLLGRVLSIGFDVADPAAVPIHALAQQNPCFFCPPHPKGIRSGWRGKREPIDIK
jgi:hypothetical protein